jgi:hypothetical protein
MNWARALTKVLTSHSQLEEVLNTMWRVVPIQDVVVVQGATVFELVASGDESILV